jgi:hypothetical protein
MMDGVPHVHLDPVERRTVRTLELEFRALDRALAHRARVQLVAETRDVALPVSWIAAERGFWRTRLRLRLGDGRTLCIAVFRCGDAARATSVWCDGCVLSCVDWEEPIGWSLEVVSPAGSERVHGYALDVAPRQPAGAAH